MITDSTRDYKQPRLPWKGSNTNLLDKVSRDITVQLLQQFGGSLCSVLQHKKYDKNSNKYGNTLLTSTKEQQSCWEKMETASNAYLSNAVFAKEKAAKGD